MSGFRGHILGSVILTTLIIFALSHIRTYFNLNIGFNTYLEIITIYAVSILFSLFPDIDTNSLGQKIFYSLIFITNIYLFTKGEYKYSAILGLVALLPVLSKHRGWTHRKLTMLIICSPFLIFPFISNSMKIEEGILFFFAAIIGYSSHLVFDGVFFKI